MEKDIKPPSCIKFSKYPEDRTIHSHKSGQTNSLLLDTPRHIIIIYITVMLCPFILPIRPIKVLSCIVKQPTQQYVWLHVSLLGCHI